MRFERRFTVNASLQDVVDFHADPANLKKLTPLPMTIHRVPDQFEEGALLEFTTWMGPIPVRWLGSFKDITGSGFTDYLVRGPFASWEHRHQFTAVDDNTTEVHDHIEAALPGNPLRLAVALMMWSGLSFLFWYRKIKTRQHN